MSKKKLGRGLDALLENHKKVDSKENKESSSVQKTDDFTSNTNSIKKIDPRILKPNPYQPRTNFSKKAMEELAASIKQHGIIQPVIITENKNGDFFILAGERRTRASIMVGLKKIPVIVADVEPEQNLELALIENIQREDLNPIEEAQAYKKLLEMYDLSQEELAKKLGKSRPAVTNIMRLLQLPEYAISAITKKEISAGHARAILSVTTQTDKKTLFNKIVNEGLSVRQAEKLAGKLNSSIKDKKIETKPSSTSTIKKLPPNLSAIQQKFLEALGTKVVIKGTEEQGTVEISYFSKDDLDSLYNKITKE